MKQKLKVNLHPIRKSNIDTENGKEDTKDREKWHNVISIKRDRLESQLVNIIIGIVQTIIGVLQKFKSVK